MNDQLFKISENISEIKQSQGRMETDLRYHIKRTNLLESKVNKLWYLVILGAGAGIANYGFDILKVLGLII